MNTTLLVLSLSCVNPSEIKDLVTQATMLFALFALFCVNPSEIKDLVTPWLCS